MKLILLLFLALTVCILTNSSLSLTYASLGLELWFQKMIPSLLPFMILSGIMVRLKLTDKISMVLFPVIGPIYRVRKNVVYCMIIGFLCGFPMGAKVTAEMLENRMLTKEEGKFLLAFCNNIGPVYFCSFVLPLLGRHMTFPYLAGMYGIPLLYGIVLRYTLFRSTIFPEQHIFTWKHQQASGETIPGAIDKSIISSLQSILTLGGYMIFFNLLNLLPHILLGKRPVLFAALLEITGGLSLLGEKLPLYSLLALSFGGLSCIAQTYSCISQTECSIENYIYHKIILTLLNGCYYLCWFLVSPESFLR